MILFLSIAFANPLIPGDKSADLPLGLDKDAIINGFAASEDDYPAAGAMLMDAVFDFGGSTQDIRTLVCSSTLIAPDVVLTAAHCLDEFSFTFGYGDLNDVDIRWTRYSDLSNWNGMNPNPPWPDDATAARDWVIHPDFDLYGIDPNAGLSQANDIALIFLDTPVLDIQHAYLPTPAQGANLQVNDEVMIIGWGQQIATGPFEQSPEGSYAFKQQGLSEIVLIDEYEFKVGELESDARKCHGDSGGPSIKIIDDTHVVIGVTSRAFDNTDCFETGGIDIRVDAYLDWIETELITRCENGTRSWCEIPGIIHPEDQPANPDSEQNSDELDDDSVEEKPASCSSTGSFDLSWMLMMLSLALVSWRSWGRKDNQE